MRKAANSFAFIDGANLHNGTKSLGWDLDYRRLRVWLSEKYGIKTAYLFIGLIPKYKQLYTFLQESGYTLVFKEVVYDGFGKPKGNCDADLVLEATRAAYEEKCDRIVIITSDGDYAGLVTFLQERQKLTAVISPSNEKKCSILLKRTGAKIVYINDQRSILRLSQNKPDPAARPQGIRAGFLHKVSAPPTDISVRSSASGGFTRNKKAPSRDGTP